MLLPNADKVIISSEKINNYVLNFEHFEGKNKARVFASALNMRKSNAEDLINLIKEAVMVTDAIKQSESEYGTKYIVDLEIVFNNNSATIRTAWIAENKDNIPRLITCYIKP